MDSVKFFSNCNLFKPNVRSLLCEDTLNERALLIAIAAVIKGKNLHLVGGILSPSPPSMAHDFGNSLISPLAISVFQSDAGFASSDFLWSYEGHLLVTIGKEGDSSRIQFLVQADAVRANKEGPSPPSMAHDFGNSLISPLAISVFQSDAGFASSDFLWSYEGHLLVTIGKEGDSSRIQFLVQADAVRANKEDPKYTLEHHVRVSPAMQCFSQFKHICLRTGSLDFKIPQWTLPARPDYTIRSSSENHKSQELI
ncbi:hypothetical protein SADUNF_Sadunf17G0112700 [Salix dunnii]|uniref:Uncharacterized protein n=1 Tax=Salix dunnii TaxID=1413687 RepID=A0A835J5Z9_9ROSI|nr:hypothetical protein SADUNF_Sadunf17G0112700 [Salix dunnii]